MAAPANDPGKIRAGLTVDDLLEILCTGELLSQAGDRFGRT